MNTTPQNTPFKQTEIGPIPQDWEVKKLGEIAKSEGGYAFKSDKFSLSGDYQVIKMSNIYGGTLDLGRSTSYLNKIDSTEEAYLLKENDILISLTGTVGKRDYGYTFRISNEKNLLLNQRVARIVASQEVNPIYLYFQVKMPFFLNQFFELAKGGTGNQANIGTKDVCEIQIPLPPLPEQTAIATALSDADALIGSLEKLIHKKRLLKQATMQHLLTPKEDWEVKKLGEIFEFKNGLNKSKEFFGYGTPIVNYVDVYKNRSLKYNDIKGKVDVTLQELKAYNVAKGDVFFTRTSETVEEIGLTSVILDDVVSTVFSGFILRARPKGKHLHIDYCKYCFSTSNIRSGIILKSSYTTRALTNGRHLSQVIISYPQFEEQTRIATILSDMDAELSGLEGKLEKYRQLKQGMMQQLLTGKIRLV